MKSRKIFLSIALATVVMSSAVAQLDNSSQFYVKVYGGYGLLTPGSYKLVSNSSSNDGSGKSNTSLSKTGLGAGIRAGGGIGVIASDFLNVGVDVEYLSGAKLKSNSSYNGSTYTYVSQTEFKYTTLSITPHVVFKAISKPDYLIYNKLGLLLNLPFDLKETEKDVETDAGVDTKYDISGTYKIGLTAGLNVALGAQFRLTDKLRAFGEIFANYLVLSPKSLDQKTVSVTGAASPVISNLHVDYIKDGQTSYTSTPNESGGTDAQSVQSVQYSKFNMNSIGINIGITYRF